MKAMWCGVCFLTSSLGMYICLGEKQTAKTSMYFMLKLHFILQFVHVILISSLAIMFSMIMNSAVLRRTNGATQIPFKDRGASLSGNRK